MPSTGRGAANVGGGKSASSAKKREFELVSPTTPEGQVTMANIRNMIAELLEPIQAEFDKLNSTIEAQSKKFDEIALVSKKVEILESNYEEIHQKLRKSEIKCKDLEEKLLDIETFSRKNNLKFMNIKRISDVETPEDCESIILNVCSQNGIKFDSRTIERAHRIGNRRKPDCPIIVKFSNFKDKLRVLNKKKNFSDSGIIVVEDFPIEIQARRRVFVPILNAAYSSGGRYKARLRSDKLLLNGKIYSVNDLNVLPQDLQLRTLSTKTVGNITGFFTRNSVLSNHFQCSFMVDGITYSSVEQFYMFHRAKYFGDDVTANTILNTDNPKDVKSLGYKVSNFSSTRWDAVRDGYMETGVKAKFEQNPELKAYLRDTQDNVLVEANPRDLYWGVGLSLDNTDIWDIAKWKGQNKLGKLLGQLREQF